MDAPKGPFPPSVVLDDFLPEPDRMALMEWALASEAAFQPATIFTGKGGQESRLDPSFRKALQHVGLGPFEAMFRNHLIARWPEIASAPATSVARSPRSSSSSTPMARARISGRISTFPSAKTAATLGPTKAKTG